MLSEYGIIDQLVVYIRFISLERVNYNQRLLYIYSYLVLSRLLDFLAKPLIISLRSLRILRLSVRLFLYSRGNILRHNADDRQDVVRGN